MKRFLQILILALFPFTDSSAQFPLPENNYRTTNNPHYWGNRLPYCGYWQQDVHYEIDARIDDTTDIIHGNFYRLTYWNNSAHSLNELYFHLYQNAFQPHSYYHLLNLENNIVVKFGKYEEQGLGTVIEDLRVNGEKVNLSLDNTVLKVALNSPLKSGDSLTVTCRFKTYFDKGTMRRRMSLYEVQGGKHYNGVHWYPTICVYDRKFTWHTDQHLDKEFYNNFGTFDVRLTFPQEYIVEATGTLVNRQEAMPDSLREKLDFKNFKEKPKDNNISVIIPREFGKTKTWQYHAENVHNFAFTADPTYRIGEVNWKGIRCIALAQEQNVYGWLQSPWFTAQVIRVYSTDFGMYEWPKIIVADAKDGMEYPMITLDNGMYPYHQGLLAHEVGHMWFYGMVGSNETYRAFLDEGFTQFLTVWAMDRIVGEKRQRKLNKKFFDKYLDSSWTRYESLYYPYINHVITGYDEPLNTHSSGFHGAIRHGGNYGLVYYKTGVMLYNLRYVLGDTLFQNAMKHYIRKWKFCHPYPEDFRDAITEYTQTDLNWFFDQWLETTKYIDYSIEDVNRISNKKLLGEYKNKIEIKQGKTYYSVVFKRKGRMEMPLDFVVHTENGRTYKYTIPNRWFSKSDSGLIVLPKWYGWDILQPTYEAIIEIDENDKIESVRIDPDLYLADIDLTNNKKGGGSIRTFQLEHHVPNTLTWDKQRNFWRPDIWYNRFDGIQVGPHFEGRYLNKYSYSASAWFNTGLGQYRKDGEKENGYQHVAFNFLYERNTNRFWHYSKINTQLYYNAGIWKAEWGFDKTFRRQDIKNPRFSKVFIKSKYLINDLSFREYLLYPEQWGPSRPGIPDDNFINAVIDLGYYRRYAYTSGNGDFTITLRTPSLGSDYNYGYLNLNSINRINFKKFEIKSRVFGQVGIGDFPFESSLCLAGANPEAYIDHRITYASAFVPLSWTGYGTNPNHFHYGGGLNLRGYSGYLAPEITDLDGFSFISFSYFGKSGASYNLEIDFDKFIKLPPKGLTKNLHLDIYLFSDAGIIGYEAANRSNFGKVRMDAGLGSTLQLKFSPYDIKPVVIRFDMPLFLNTPPATEDYFQFRYVVGINRAF
jgi:aminopeptidase N